MSSVPSIEVSPLLSHPGDWMRIGRGRSLQFFATDEEVETWLRSSLPVEYGPFRLVDAQGSLRGRSGVKRVIWDVSEFLEQLGSYGSSTIVHIWSEALTPNLLSEVVDDFSAACSLSGLPSLDHGYVRKGMQESSSLAMVERIQNKETGEIREHSGYRKVYNRLSRAIKKSLCYSTFHRFADGSEEEDTSLRRMTEAAAQAHGNGIVFTARPGRRL